MTYKTPHMFLYEFKRLQNKKINKLTPGVNILRNDLLKVFQIFHTNFTAFKI